ncbi:tetraacyldisaccharide 4'-kinase [Pseudodesulfovibrio tunisiensis]|uniref:tetraacyldisaccharide 4'-kinase n=1 Tax=Pseudodesulfovibrio tunisiensis TaxID=463192 RepID=UPI001FB47ABC|nr:tetraacyldisaccharide 4'-kinase [Pseudodesulfovibrio tunisiensis]
MSQAAIELQRTFSPVLRPFSWVYSGVMRMRGALYGRGLLRTWEPPALTVSVGNVGWGGSGKTPLCGWLLGWARRQGVPSLLLTRGYRAKPVSYPYLVKPGALAEEAGDEPLMLAQDHPDARIVVDPVRSRAGRWAFSQFRPGLVVLDDGFQHMAVKRHVDIVLLTPHDVTEGWNTVIPAGSWREPVSSLRRADAFVLKASPNTFRSLMPLIEERLTRLKKPVFSYMLQPTGVRNLTDGTRQKDFGAGGYVLVSGVGAPAQVRGTAKAYFGYGPAKHMVYDDHHAFTKNDVLDMQVTARRLGCEAVLCTPKDAVKLGPMCSEEFWKFDLQLAFGPSAFVRDTPFDTWWNRRYKAFELRREDNLAWEREQSDSENGSDGDLNG